MRNGPWGRTRIIPLGAARVRRRLFSAGRLVLGAALACAVGFGIVSGIGSLSGGLPGVPGLTVIRGAVAAKAQPAAMGAEVLDGRRAVIVDGDTFKLAGETFRVENIDAPESFRSRCEAELVAGLKAKERLAGLLRSGVVLIERNGQDRYRRTLARVSASGRDIGETLIREGLALPWQSGPEAKDERGRHWCG